MPFGITGFLSFSCLSHKGVLFYDLIIFQATQLKNIHYLSGTAIIYFTTSNQMSNLLLSLAFFACHRQKNHTYNQRQHLNHRNNIPQRICPNNDWEQ